MKKHLLAVLSFCLMPSLLAEGGSPCPSKCAHYCCMQSESRNSLDLTASLLVWRASEGGLLRGWGPNTVVDSTSGTLTTSSLDASSDDFDFPWNAGVRAGFNYWIKESCVNIEGLYTHYQASARDNGDDLLNWDVSFDEADGLFAFGFEWSCLTISPFLGVRGSWISQTFRRDFTSTLTVDGVLTTIDTNIYNHERYTGVGPILGFASAWKLGCGFGMFAWVDGATLFGNANVDKERTEISTSATTTTVTTDDVARRFSTCQLTIDAGFGVSWETTFNCFHIIPQISWEHHRYLNHNPFGSYGDLCFDGLNLAIFINF